MASVSRETVEAVAADFGLPLSAADQLDRLLAALAAEPDPHTTVSEPDRAVDLHLRDSLVALAVPGLRDASAVADIGAGAGFPGLPLAVALPHARVDLIESASRKVAVIERLASAAYIGNGLAVHARVEEWALGEGATAYDFATARAVAPLAVLVEYAAPLLRVGGTFIAWKGSAASADDDFGDSEARAGEVAARQLGLEVLEPLPVTPFAGARDLWLYLYSKVEDTPPTIPRRPGIARKRPLGA
jgi:16S rRNA (guanine527-N7)-methyltransferase